MFEVDPVPGTVCWLVLLGCKVLGLLKLPENPPLGKELVAPVGGCLRVV